jgi:hypothetical protein
MVSVIEADNINLHAASQGLRSGQLLFQGLFGKWTVRLRHAGREAGWLKGRCLRQGADYREIADNSFMGAGASARMSNAWLAWAGIMSACRWWPMLFGVCLNLASPRQLNNRTWIS